MHQLSVREFLDTVERSGLVEKSRLEQTLAELESASGLDALSDSFVVSSHLAQKGLLTPWQAEQLLDGRYVGFFLGRYKLLSHLGTGGMSSVYLAEHTLMRRKVAIKILPASRVHDTSYLARFHREARAVAALDHPNIVRAFDVGNEGEMHFLVMQYIEGRDLRAIVERDGPLDIGRAVDYLQQAAEGLAHAHQAGLIHRDVKPANLLIDSQGTVKLLDLGLARFDDDDTDASLTRQFDEKVLGTVDYLAPEQAVNSHQVDQRADIYSLGCTLYYALVGKPPFGSGTLAQRVLMHQLREPPALEKLRPDVPAALAALCRRMMAKSPSARYQSAEEVSRALAACLTKGPNVAAKSAAEDYALELAPLDDEGAAANSAPETPASGSDVQGRNPQSRSASGPSKPAVEPTMPSPAAEREPRAWVDLLSDLPPLPAAQPSRLSGSPRSASGKSSVAKRSRWESPWFLIGFGSLLGMAVVLSWFICHLLAR